METKAMKLCEVCGEEKTLAEFSKSYKNRCKKCVAEETRLKRHGTYNKPIFVVQNINWEQRRYELIKGYLLCYSYASALERNMLTEYLKAADFADNLIERFKQDKYYEQRQND